MDGTQILTLGLGLQAPWKLKDQHLDTTSSPHRLELYVEADRDAARHARRMTLPTSPGDT